MAASFDGFRRPRLDLLVRGEWPVKVCVAFCTVGALQPLAHSRLNEAAAAWMFRYGCVLFGHNDYICAQVHKVTFVTGERWCRSGPETGCRRSAIHLPFPR